MTSDAPFQVANDVPRGSGRRLNDGKPDPAGRCVVGSLSLRGISSTEVLVQVGPDGSITPIDDDLTLSNGLAWTANGASMYSVDTGLRRVFVRPYDAATGTTGSRSVFAEIVDGYPDGICLDAEGHLWVAVWVAGEVRRYAPDGSLVLTYRIPAPNTSAVAFAGEDLSTFVVTTATYQLNAYQRAQYPLSGRLFTADIGVRGTPQSLWGGFRSPGTVGGPA